MSVRQRLNGLDYIYPDFWSLDFQIPSSWFSCLQIIWTGLTVECLSFFQALFFSTPPNFRCIFATPAGTMLESHSVYCEPFQDSVMPSPGWRLQTYVILFVFTYTLPGPVGWGCRIHRRHLCRRVRPPSNECPGYDTKQWWWSSNHVGALRNSEYPFIAIAPMSTLSWCGSSW